MPGIRQSARIAERNRLSAAAASSATEQQQAPTPQATSTHTLPGGPSKRPSPVRQLGKQGAKRPRLANPSSSNAAASTSSAHPGADTESASEPASLFAVIQRTDPVLTRGQNPEELERRFQETFSEDGELSFDGKAWLRKFVIGARDLIRDEAQLAGWFKVSLDTMTQHMADAGLSLAAAPDTPRSRTVAPSRVNTAAAPTPTASEPSDAARPGAPEAVAASARVRDAGAAGSAFALRPVLDPQSKSRLARLFDVLEKVSPILAGGKTDPTDRINAALAFQAKLSLNGQLTSSGRAWLMSFVEKARDSFGDAKDLADWFQVSREEIQAALDSLHLSLDPPTAAAPAHRSAASSPAAAATASTSAAAQAPTQTQVQTPAQSAIQRAELKTIHDLIEKISPISTQLPQVLAVAKDGPESIASHFRGLWSKKGELTSSGRMWLEKFVVEGLDDIDSLGQLASWFGVESGEIKRHLSANRLPLPAETLDANVPGAPPARETVSAAGSANESPASLASPTTVRSQEQEETALLGSLFDVLESVSPFLARGKTDRIGAGRDFRNRLSQDGQLTPSGRAWLMTFLMKARDKVDSMNQLSLWFKVGKDEIKRCLDSKNIQLPPDPSPEPSASPEPRPSSASPVPPVQIVVSRDTGSLLTSARSQWLEADGRLNLTGKALLVTAILQAGVQGAQGVDRTALGQLLGLGPTGLATELSALGWDAAPPDQPAQAAEALEPEALLQQLRALMTDGDEQLNPTGRNLIFSVAMQEEPALSTSEWARLTGIDEAQVQQSADGGFLREPTPKAAPVESEQEPAALLPSFRQVVLHASGALNATGKALLTDVDIAHTDRPRLSQLLGISLPRLEQQLSGSSAELSTDSASDPAEPLPSGELVQHLRSLMTTEDGQLGPLGKRLIYTDKLHGQRISTADWARLAGVSAEEVGSAAKGKFMMSTEAEAESSAA